MVINAPYKIRLFGTKHIIESDNSSECLESSLTAVSDLVSIDLYTYSYGSKGSNESSDVTGSNNTTIENNRLYKTLDFELNEYSVTDDEQQYQNLLNVLAKKHKYIKQSLTPYNVNLHTTNYVKAVVLTDLSTEISDGVKDVTISFRYRKPLIV